MDVAPSNNDPSNNPVPKKNKKVHLGAEMALSYQNIEDDNHILLALAGYANVLLSEKIGFLIGVGAGGAIKVDADEKSEKIKAFLELQYEAQLTLNIKSEDKEVWGRVGLGVSVFHLFDDGSNLSAGPKLSACIGNQKNYIGLSYAFAAGGAGNIHSLSVSAGFDF